MTLVELIDKVRAACDRPRLDSDHLNVNNETFLRYRCSRDGLGWLSDLLGVPIRLDEDSRAVLLCDTADQAKELARSADGQASGAELLLMVGLWTLVAAYPDWITADQDGAILSWLYPVSLPTGPDAWARQFVTAPLPVLEPGSRSRSRSRPKSS